MKLAWIISSGIVLSFLITNLYGADYVVDEGTDSSVNTGGYSSGSLSGDFRYVLNQILNQQAQEGSPSTNTVTFAVPQVILTRPPPLINLFNNTDIVTIGNPSGSPTIIDGGGVCRPFFVVQGTTTLQNLTIQNGLAQGGNGGTGGCPASSGGAGAGGAGAGLGGALFIDSGAVIINNVNFISNTASAGLGGQGQNNSVNGGGGGGGGMGGNGGNGTGGGGAGGGGGVVGNGGSSHTLAGASFSYGGGGGGAGGNGGSGDAATVGGGGGAIIGAYGGDGTTAATGNNGGTVGSYVFGGGGGSGSTTGGTGGGIQPGTPSDGRGSGGGYNGGLNYGCDGGIGGGGGGGGGNNQASGGLGGGGGAGSSNSSFYGGGGGAGFVGGNGGPGGGGAVTTYPGGTGSGGFGGGGDGGGGSAGCNATNSAGGDGGACGGAIFINAANLNYASLTVQGNCTFSNNGVSANSGLGAAVGSDLFIYSYNGPATAINFAPGTGNTVIIKGIVADDSSTSISGTSTWLAGSGSGSSLTMQGPGTLVLEGNNTYIGGTTVSGGRLSVNGSILGGINVTVAGTIGGVGTIYGGGSIYGTLSPGNSIGTLTLDTTTAGVSLLCKAITNIEIAPGAASLVLVTGPNGIILNNTTLNITADPGDYGKSGSYSILEGVYSGLFDPRLTGGLSSYTYSLSYASEVIYLLYQLIPIPLAVHEKLFTNPLSVANYLMDYGPARAAALINTLTGSTLTNALNSISPSRNAFSSYIASQVTFSLSNFLGQHIDSFRSKERSRSEVISAADLIVKASDFEIPVKQKDKDSPCHGWISEFGEAAHQAASVDDPSFNFYTGSVLAGLDYKFNHEGLLGGSLGYAYTHFVEDLQRGSGKIDYYFANVYGNAAIGNFYFSPAIWGIFHQIKNKRNISFPNYFAEAKANIYAWQCVPHLEIGYNIKHSLTSIIPFTQLDWAVTWQRGYHEQGGGYFNAKLNSQSTSILRSETGIKRSDHWSRSWGQFFLKEKFSYVYEKPFGTGNVTTAFVGSPGSFTVAAAAVNEVLNLADVAIEFGAAVGKKRPTLLQINFEGQVGFNYWSTQMMFTVGF